MLKSCNIHLDLEDQKEKPTIIDVKRISNRITQTKVEVNAEELSKLVTSPHSRTWLPGLMQAKRNNENWTSQQVFAIDIDDGLPFDLALQRLHEFRLDCTFAYSTFSSGPENNKYRMVFFLDREITTVEEFEIVKQGFLHLFPEMDKKCATPSSMFHGGKELIYRSYNYLLDYKELKTASDIFYIASANNERTRQDRTKKVADYDSSIYNIMDLPRNAEISLVRDFDYEIATKKCRILNDFANGEWIYHPQLFGIATNLLHVKGGLGWMMDIMKRCGRYNSNNFAIVPYVRKMNYSPQRLVNFSPYTDDHNYKNILQAGKLQSGEVVRISELSEKKLAEMDIELRTLIHDIQFSEDTYIHVIKVPTGVGKTENILYLEKAIIACPTHELKKEVKARFKAKAVVTPELPFFSNDKLNNKIESLFRAGGSNLVSKLIRDIAYGKSLKTPIEEQDRINAQQYLAEMESAKIADMSVITTHHRNIQDFKQETIVFDEDPIQSILLPIEEISISDILLLKSAITDSRDRSTLENLIGELGKSSPLVVYPLKKYAFRDYDAIEEAVINLPNLTSPVLNFLNGGAYVVDEHDNNKIYFSKSQPFDENRKIIILSATANEWIYRQLFGDRVRFHDLGMVEMKGKLVQDTAYTFSRQNLHKEEVLKYATEKAGDRMVITFMSHLDSFRNAARNVYFGNCKGTNILSGKKIAIVGTPHAQMSTYLLLADKLGIDTNPSDFRLTYQRVLHNGLEFKFNTFDNLQLRNIQFFYIESELRQAVGRARFVRYEGADVLLLSNYPLPEATFCFEISEIGHGEPGYEPHIENSDREVAA